MKKHALIEHLRELAKREDRGALAALRRGLGKRPGTAIEAFPYVVPFIPELEQAPSRSWPYFVVASLFGAHPSDASEQSFGATFHRLKDSPSRDARFKALLNAQSEELPGHLRQAVAQLAAHEIPIDWDTLLHHLRRWSHPDRYVQQRWARDFWTPAVNTVTE